MAEAVVFVSARDGHAQKREAIPIVVSFIFILFQLGESRKALAAGQQRAH